MDPLFIGPKLKIKRANQHIDELQRIFTAFLKTDFYKLYVEVDAKANLNVVKFEPTGDLPCEVPLIIGDAVHNLRAALDLMACEIVVLSGDTPDKWTLFPFQSDRNQLIATINGGKIKAAASAIIDLIIDTIKPYKGGNDPLCALNDLDIVDKHRLLIPITHVTALVGVDMADERGNTFTNTTLMVGKGGQLKPVASNSTFKITKQGKAAIGVFFDKGQVFEGKPVIETLHQLSQLVSGVVQTIEKAYLARAQAKP